MPTRQKFLSKTTARKEVSNRVWQISRQKPAAQIAKPPLHLHNLSYQSDIPRIATFSMNNPTILSANFISAICLYPNTWLHMCCFFQARLLSPRWEPWILDARDGWLFCLPLPSFPSIYEYITIVLFSASRALNPCCYMRGVFKVVRWSFGLLLYVSTSSKWIFPSWFVDVLGASW